ncbi:hypothetical protein [Candidiatus Paracoxiella cheracis]|uniref:hypothetical protein n=1 Tax=Candidiatus Paracoxiella cheracis TaxID=3405120 RepID=UPI003BF53FF9
MTARKDFLQSLTLGKKSEPTAEYAPSLRSPWRASLVIYLSCIGQERKQLRASPFTQHKIIDSPYS